MANPIRGVDSHAHVFSAGAAAVAGARYRPAYEASLDAWRGHWADGGITHGVLVQPSFFGTDNGEMLDAVARDPTHLRAVVVVDRMASAQELSTLAQRGAVALRYNLHGVGHLDAAFNGAGRALLERAAALGWHLEVFANRGAVPRIARLLAPIAIPVVFDHFAAPDADGAPTYAALRELARTHEVWCKLSAPYRAPGCDPAALAARCIESVGDQRVVWGSDWPFTRHEEANRYEDLRAALGLWVGPLTPRILWDNPARLYRFDR
jgi:predicted TIM-barrel fold metal-dependent hydrolase